MLESLDSPRLEKRKSRPADEFAPTQAVLLGCPVQFGHELVVELNDYLFSRHVAII